MTTDLILRLARIQARASSVGARWLAARCDDALAGDGDALVELLELEAGVAGEPEAGR